MSEPSVFERVVADALMPGGYADDSTFAAARDVLHALATDEVRAALHDPMWEAVTEFSARRKMYGTDLALACVDAILAAIRPDAT